MAVDTVARVSATVLDDEGIKATVLSHIHMDPTKTVNEIKAAAAAWAHAVDVLTGARITDLRFHIGLADTLAAAITAHAGDAATGVKPAVIADSEVQEAGIFDFSVEGTPYHWGMVIPAILETLTAGGRISLAGDVAALETLLHGAVLGGRYTNQGTDALGTIVRGFRGDRKRRRALYGKTVSFK